MQEKCAYSKSFGANRTFCAFTVGGTAAASQTVDQQLALAGCYRGTSHCEGITSKTASNPLAVKQICDEEPDCRYDQGYEFKTADCHAELLRLGVHHFQYSLNLLAGFRKYGHICGQCRFHKAGINTHNATGLGFIPTVGGLPELNAADQSCTTPACKGLAQAAAWDAEASQLEEQTPPARAETLYLQAANTRSLYMRDAHPDVVKSYENIVRFYLVTGQPGKARAMRFRVTLQKQVAAGKEVSVKEVAAKEFEAGER